MDINRINDMVDRKVIQSFQEGFSIGAIQSDLMVRMKNFMKTIEKDDSATYQELYNSEFSQISNIRLRYGITYIKQCEKRIKDLSWIFEKKKRFPGHANSQIFKMIQFKEKMLKKEDLVA
jgi:hypothetical protein